MPWQITENDDRCPASKPWAVIKQDDGELEGCHATEGDAQDQLAALNAAENEASAMPIRSDDPLHYIDVIRGVQPLERGDGNAMIGYPVVFNEWAEITSFDGAFLERVDRRALNRTLNDRGDRVKVQFDHGMHPQIGSLPLGKPSVMKPDERGMFVEVPLSDTAYNRDIIKPLLRDGAIDGMSFRFQVMKDEWDEEPQRSDHNPDGLPERTITEVRLFEFGPVTFPAYEATQVGIRSQAAFRLWQETPPEKRAEVLADAGLRSNTQDDDDSLHERSPDTDDPLAERSSNADDSPEGRSQDNQLSNRQRAHMQRRTELQGARLELILQGADRYVQEDP